MFIYDYVRVYNDLSGYGMLAGTKYKANEKYKQIIDEKGKDGWRYVGFIPTVQRGTGHIEEMDLVFEKEE